MEHVFIMREACHVDMTGFLGIDKKSAVEHTWLIAIDCLIHCPRKYRPRYNCIKLLEVVLRNQFFLVVEVMGRREKNLSTAEKHVL